jgi:hypothetical protein
VRRIPEDGDPGDPSDDFLEQLQPFRGEFLGHVGQSRDIAAWPRETGNESGPDGIKIERHDNHDNRDRARRFLGGLGYRRPPRHDDVHWALDQLGRGLAEPIEFPLRKAVLNDDTLALHVAKLTEALPESLCAGRGAGREREIPYPGELRWRLCVGDKRHCEDAEGEDYYASGGAAPQGARLTSPLDMPAITVGHTDHGAHSDLLTVLATPLSYLQCCGGSLTRKLTGAALFAASGGALC